MKAFTVTLIVFCCGVASVFGEEEFGAGGGNSSFVNGSISISRPFHPRPNISRPVVVVRPQPPRPVVIVRPAPVRPEIVQHPSVIVIHRRPESSVPIINPVTNPAPLYTVQLASNYLQCIKNGETIFEHCHSQVTRSYDPASLNTTWRACCSTYAESSCYIDYADQYCPSSSIASGLIKHSQDVANYFSASICQAVPFNSWASACALSQEDVSKKYNPNSKQAFISLPTTGTDLEKIACLDKLRGQPEGDFTQKCLNASLTAWDPNRSKIVTSKMYESCCAMYDALDCLINQAKGICTGHELDGLIYYKAIATGAFSQGVCRSVPYANGNQVCRG